MLKKLWPWIHLSPQSYLVHKKATMLNIIFCVLFHYSSTLQTFFLIVQKKHKILNIYIFINYGDISCSHLFHTLQNPEAKEFPLTHSGLKIQSCLSSSLGHLLCCTVHTVWSPAQCIRLRTQRCCSCGLDLIPGPGTSICHGPQVEIKLLETFTDSKCSPTSQGSSVLWGVHQSSTWKTTALKLIFHTFKLYDNQLIK